MTSLTGPAVLAVTPNPALDITLAVDALHPGATQRLESALRVLGGKGFNVASVAAEQGYTAWALGPVAAADLADCHRRGAVRESTAVLALSDTPTPLRATYAIHQHRTNATTIINERGGAHPEATYTDIIAQVRSGLTQHPGSVVTLSGSFPPQAPAGFVTDLITAAHAAGGQVIVDCAGDPLLTACRAGVDLIKPNAQELRDTTGCEDLLAGAQQLHALGAHRVVVSDGEAGLLLVTGESVHRARLARVLAGNPTGAGDALVAALATGLIDGLTADDLLTRAVAWSAAAVLQPTAGTIGTAWRELTAEVIQSSPDAAPLQRPGHGPL